MTRLRARSKIWLEIDGRAVLGRGRLTLLEAVGRNGTISGAARDLGISYRKAWSQLDEMEKQLPFPLLERKTGGKGGGQARLTPRTEAMMEDFRRLLDGCEEFVDQRFREVFK